MSVHFHAASVEHQKREKVKARLLRQSLWWRQQVGRGFCHHCKQAFKPSELTMDHLVPIARGGLSQKRNVVASCKECNTKKGYRLPIDEAFQELESQKT